MSTKTSVELRGALFDGERIDVDNDRVFIERIDGQYAYLYERVEGTRFADYVERNPKSGEILPNNPLRLA